MDKKDIIKNTLVNIARKAMLDNIDSIDDIKFLQKELKEHLRKEFDLQNKLEEKDEIIDEATNFIVEHSRKEPPYYEFLEFNNAANLSELLEILERGKSENNSN